MGEPKFPHDELTSLCDAVKRPDSASDQGLRFMHARKHPGMGGFKDLRLAIGLLLVSTIAIWSTISCSTGITYPTTTAHPTNPSHSSNTVPLTAYGAKCDGQHDDQLSLQGALNDVSSKGGGVVVLPPSTCRIVQTESAPSTSLTGSVSIRGVLGKSTLLFDSDHADEYRELFKVSGAGASLYGVKLVRASDIYGVMIDIGASTDLALDNVVIDGKKDRFHAKTFHGIKLGGSSGDVIKNVTMVNTVIQNVDYGVYQASDTRSITDGFHVDSSIFTHNYADDLELNAPEGGITHVSVKNSRFSSNKMSDDSYAAGFGVGLSNVQHALIENNTFDGYRLEPVHIEDRSAFVTVSKNSFANSFTASASWASHIFIIGSSHDISITGNTFDTTANSNLISCVYVGAGGQPTAPYNVSITGNTFELRSSAKDVAVYGATDVTTSSNRTVPVE
jgi:polygalacturonase